MLDSVSISVSFQIEQCDNGKGTEQSQELSGAKTAYTRSHQLCMKTQRCAGQRDRAGARVKAWSDLLGLSPVL